MGPERSTPPPSRDRTRTGSRAVPALALVALVVLTAAPLPGVSSHLGSAAPFVGRGDSPPAHYPSVVGPAPRPAGFPLARPAAFSLGDSGDSPTSVSLNWTATTDLWFGNYTVDVSATGASGSFTSVGVITSQSTTSFVATQLSPGGTYYWLVIENGFFGSTNSSVFPATQPPLASLTYWHPSPTSVQLNWTNNASYGGGISFASYAVYEGVGGATPTAVANFSSSAKTNYTISGLSPGSSYAAYIDTSDCVAGCGTAFPQRVVTESNLVTIGTPLPLSVSVVATRTVVDTGQSDLFLCTPSGGVSPFTFAWNFGNGTFSPGGSSTAHSYGSPGIANITCKVTDSTPSTRTSATSIFVNPSPVLEISTNRSAADVGQSITYLCAATGGTAPVSAGWTLGDGSTLTLGNGTHTYATAGHYLAECTASDATSTIVGASVPLTVSPLLVVHATVNALAAAPGTTLSFHATAVNGSGGYSGFRWSFGDVVGSFPGANVTHAFLSTSNFTVVAHAKDSNGALAAAFLSVDVTPVVVHAQGGSAGAPGQSIAFSATAGGGAGTPYNFTWKFGDGAVAYGASVHHAYGSAGTFRPTLTVTDPLGANNTTRLAAVPITVPPGPAPFFTVWTDLLIAALIAAVLGVGIYVARRRAARNAFDSMQGRVPPSGPDDVVKGAKVCANCGVSNLPIRKTCTNCGRPLRRSPFG